MKVIPAIYEKSEIRRILDEKKETWFFSVVDIVHPQWRLALRRPTK